MSLARNAAESGDPRRLLRVIALVNADGIGPLALLLETLENPVTRVLGFVALAQRSPELRVRFLRRAAGLAQELAPDLRARVLTAVFDAFPEAERKHLLALAVDLIQELPADERRRLRRRQQVRELRAQVGSDLQDEVFEIAPKAFGPSEAPDINSVGAALQRIERTLTNQSGDASLESPSLDQYKYFQIKPMRSEVSRPRKPRVRLPEVASSMGFAPGSTDSGSSPAKRVDQSEGRQAGYTRRVTRAVSTGVADETGRPNSKPILPLSKFYFFVEIGEAVAGALSYEALPEDTLDSAVLDVVLFENESGPSVEGPSMGRVTISRDGIGVVSQSASEPDQAGVLTARRLFFALRAPGLLGLCSIRCNIYCRGVLLQSYELRIPVGSDQAPRVETDYLLTRLLALPLLATLGEPRLSVMINEDLGGSHSFRFYSSEGSTLSRSVTLSDQALSDLILKSRKSLRKVAWGTKSEWTQKQRYRFASHRTVDHLLPDLWRLARCGHILWDGIVDSLGEQDSEALRERMRLPGEVHIALREGSNAYVPAALFYDHLIDIHLRCCEVQLCEDFKRSLGDDVAAGVCFAESCPSREEPHVVCPSGFWGFRHTLGFPMSLTSSRSAPRDVAAFLTAGEPSIRIAISTDPLMSKRDSHIEELRTKATVAPPVADTQLAALDGMRNSKDPIVYFYCHGGMSQQFGPYIQVGPRDGPPIGRTDLRRAKIKWTDVRPLIFINGCHTTRVAPEEALNLVSAFVVKGASGVIGTETTVFESLATEFAEYFFDAFVAGGRSVGAAVKHARLRLLQSLSLNPLGLVYVPFVLPSIKLMATQAQISLTRLLPLHTRYVGAAESSPTGEAHGA